MQYHLASTGRVETIRKVASPPPDPSKPRARADGRDQSENQDQFRLPHSYGTCVVASSSSKGQDRLPAKSPHQKLQNTAGEDGDSCAPHGERVCG